jgi:hypothetical protein
MAAHLETGSMLTLNEFVGAKRTGSSSSKADLVLSQYDHVNYPGEDLSRSSEIRRNTSAALTASYDGTMTRTLPVPIM